MNTKLNKIKEALKKSSRKSWDFCLNNKGLILQVAVLAVVVPTVGFCNPADDIKIEPLQGPIDKILGFVTGPFPIAITMIAGSLGGLAWGMGLEQNILQRAWKIVAGGGIATSIGGAGLTFLGLDNVSGCIF